MSIRSFRHKGLKRLFEDDDRRAVPAGQAQKIADVLAALDTAEEPADVGLFPGWRLHPLKGNLKGLAMPLMSTLRTTIRKEILLCP